MAVWGKWVRLNSLHCTHINMRAFKTSTVSGCKVYEQLDERWTIFLKQFVGRHSLFIKENSSRNAIINKAMTTYY